MRMLWESELLKKTKLENTMNEWKNSLEKLNPRLNYMEERINNIKD